MQASSPCLRRYDGLSKSMRETLVLSAPSRMTPTIWAHMRLCRLRGVLACTSDAEAWVLHDPRRWLGTAFHRVMQVAARPGVSAEDVELAWSRAVAKAATAAAEHPLDSRFDTPERWPGYFLARQRAMASATQVRVRVTAWKDRQRGAIEEGRGTERLVQTRDGLLAGRPDSYDGRTIVDYKSSLPDRNWLRATEILDEYQRQLRLYAAILADVGGSWPVTARIVAASGETVEYRIDEVECAAEAKAALEALAHVKRELSQGTAPETLANPSSASCGRCPFQMICPGFWKWIEHDGFQDSSVAVAAKVVSIDVGHDSDLYTAQVVVLASSCSLDREQTVTLRRSAHGDLVDTPPGSRWRIVSASARPNMRLRSSLSTVVLPEDTVPRLALSYSNT